uniref:Mating hormone A-factor 1&2 n=1 Tax=Siphoviridae sp. ctevH2 TaxID=2825593 RepID=A0A8S5UAZ8_9CAUD|nr:MAG TPA: Mating hormone A-factor 1&2 [Siphoviridae sp. ctevH2]
MRPYRPPVSYGIRGFTWDYACLLSEKYLRDKAHLCFS